MTKIRAATRSDLERHQAPIAALAAIWRATADDRRASDDGSPPSPVMTDRTSAEAATSDWMEAVVTSSKRRSRAENRIVKRSGEVNKLGQRRAHAEELRVALPDPMKPAFAAFLALLAAAEVALLQAVWLVALDLANPGLLERIAVGAVAACLIPIAHVTGTALRKVAGPERHDQLVAALGVGALVIVLAAVATARFAVEVSVGQVLLPAWVMGAVGAAPSAAALILATHHREASLEDKLLRLNISAAGLVGTQALAVSEVITNADRDRSAQQLYAASLINEAAASHGDAFGPGERVQPPFAEWAHPFADSELIVTWDQFEALVARSRAALRTATTIRPTAEPDEPASAAVSPSGPEPGRGLTSVARTAASPWPSGPTPTIPTL